MVIPADMMAVRRSMLSSPSQSQVHEFLGPITASLKFPRTQEEAISDFGKIVGIVRPLIQSNPPMKDMLSHLADYVSQPMDPALEEMFRRVGRPDSTMLRTFVTTVHARTLWVLRTSLVDSNAMVGETAKLLQNPAAAVDKLRESVDKLDQHFPGHLIVEAEVRAREDAAFEGNLNGALHAFWHLKPAAEDAVRATAKPDPGLRVLGMEYAGQWWHLPTHVSFAISIWGQGD